MQNPEEGRGCFIYFAVFTVSLAAFATGSCFSWTSPMLPKFSSNDTEVNPIGRPVTIWELAWIASAMNLGMFCAPLVSIVCLKFFTKKTVLIISMVPLLVAHINCYFTSNPNIFIFARFSMGAGTGMVWTVLGTYIAEISEDGNRGLLGSVPGLMVNLGSLLVYIIGPYLNMQTFSIVILIPLMLFYIAFGILVPDSPYDLLIMKKEGQAKNSLRKLRRAKSVEKELTVMKETIQFGFCDRVSLGELLKDRGLRKGLIICVTLMTFQQFSGIAVVVSYAENIFLFAGSFIPSAISPMILGVIATMGTLVNVLLIDKAGRKVLLTVSCILESISLFFLGLYFYLLDSRIDISVLSWLPLVSLMVFMMGFNLGLGIVPWIVVGEVFHSKIKPLASTITALTNYVWSFIVTICFPYMVEYLGMAWTFWAFFSGMILSSIFCVTILPETNGKSFQDIQKMLKK